MKQTEHIYLGRINLAEGAQAQNSFNFPKGEFFRALWLHFHIPLEVTGTPSGNTEFTNPVLEVLKQIQFQTDKDGHSHNLSAKMLYYISQLKGKTAPRIDNASFDSNSTGVYTMTLSVPLYFSDPDVLRPEDCGLDSNRYSQMFLRLSLGTAENACSATSTFAGQFNSPYCDVELERYAGKVRETIKPLLFPVYDMEATPVSTATGFIDLIRASDRLLKRLFILTTDKGASARPFSGNGIDTMLDKVELETEDRIIQKDRYIDAIKNENKIHFGLESLPAGLYVFDFIKDKSHFSALPTGDFAKLQATMEYDGSAPAGSILAIASESVRSLKV